MLTKHLDKWERFKRHGDRQARSDLISEFVALVHYVFGRMSLYLPNVLDDSDLIAAGTIGLIMAVDDFDIERGIQFSTFAVPRIRGAILDELREHDWVPRTARRRAAELNVAMEKSRDSVTSAPNFGKVARLMGIEIGDLSKLMSRVKHVSFVPLDHSPSSEDDGNMSVSQLLADDNSRDPLVEVELSDQLLALKNALNTLPETERRLVMQYYFEERMQKDIAKDLHVSRSRVSQIHNHAITSIKDRMAAAGAA
jgi:RNA polymerase sigma factor FliA